MDQEIVFIGTNGVRIAGSLMLPAGPVEGTKVPAMLIVQGSGPTDRNGNQPPGHITDLEKQIAEKLASLGIASLRYDKRGMHANAADMPKNVAALTQFARWDFQVGDAAAAWRFLGAQTGIDSGRVGVFGHSEGGMIALELAAGADETHRVRPAAIVLAATPGRPLGAVLRDQLEILGRRQGAPDDINQKLLAISDGAIEHIKATGEIPTGLPPGIAPLYPAYLRLFLQSLFKLDPIALAQRVEGPVLLLNGDRDPQVLSMQDAEPLAKALKLRAPGSTSINIIAGASHALKPSANMDENNHAGPVAPEAMRALTTWLQEIGWTR